jgi:dGTPase
MSLFSTGGNVDRRFDRWRASYASDPAQSRGRHFAETHSPTRSEFQRDRDRIIHSTAFRRLKHKTQVFVFHEGDHFRTRLTHTIEVAQIARSIARALGLDEDLAEALALSHDLGHTPFGHTGEDVLHECLLSFGGFDHNAQALRIVTRLERRYPDFDGLNLTWETREGLVKHNGPLMDKIGNPLPKYQKSGIPNDILVENAQSHLDLASFAGPEAQVAALADDIAYNTHDIDDGLRAGMFSLADLAHIPFVGDILAEIMKKWPNLEETRIIHELTRRLITRFVEGVIDEGNLRLAPFQALKVEAVRQSSHPVIAFNQALATADKDIKTFLFANMYRNPNVMRVRSQAENVLRDLYRSFNADSRLLPEDWQIRLKGADERDKAYHIADYIAGMTDRFALEEHRRLFDATPDLR